MMEVADEIEWYGDSEERFIERAIEREAWGNYNGNHGLGVRFIREVQDKISEISKNLNLYQQRTGEERVAPLLSSGYVLVYRKEHFEDARGTMKARLTLLDVRKSY
ncbi:MAG: hypothetical protein HYV97_05140 [Bdellovibrio sp.]|nr:hypothetical protein [Bdellovibrio sp.]